MSICKKCKGLGSVPVSKERSGNKRRCTECNGTGLEQPKPTPQPRSKQGE